MRGTTVKLIPFQPEGDQSGRGTSFSSTPNDTQFSFSSVSAVECLSLDVAFPYRPPLDHVLRDTVPVFYETI